MSVFILPLPIFASSPLSAILVCFSLSLPLPPRKKKLCLIQSTIWIRQRKHWVINSPLHSFIHIQTYIHLAQERYLGTGRGRRAEAWGNEKEWKREVCRVEDHVFTPFCTVNHREKGALLMACVGPRRRQVEMEEMIAEMLFYWGDAGISLVGMEGSWERLRLSVCLPLIEVGRRASGCSNTPNNTPHDKFTRHHFLRVLVRGFEELRQRDSSNVRQEGRDKSASESYYKRVVIIYVCACT